MWFAVFFLWFRFRFDCNTYRARIQESPVVKVIEDGPETLSSAALSVEGDGGLSERSGNQATDNLF